MLSIISKFITSGKFWISTDKRTAEHDGVTLGFGPTIQGSINCTADQCEVKFDTPLPTGHKNILLGMGVTVSIDKVVIEQSQITAYAGGRKFRAEFKEVS